MDVSDLERRYGTLPKSIETEVNAVWEQLSKQSEHVISAKALANFDVDPDMTMLYGKTHRGLIVTLKPTYVVSKEDTWIPTNLHQVRALFESGSYQHVDELADTNCSVGIYDVHKTNAIGEFEKDSYTIVDTHLKDQAIAEREAWNGKRVSEVYSTAKRDETLKYAKDLAKPFGVDKMLRADFTNVLYRGSKSYHFYNNAFKDTAMVLVSPLAGYKLVEAQDHPADLMGTDLVDVKALSAETQRRLYEKVHWAGCELVNTFVMRKSYSDITASHRMRQASFSDTPIHQLMDPETILKLTPSAEHIPDSFMVHEHFYKNRLDIPITPGVAIKLMGLRDVYKILNPEFYSNKQLTLPRDIVQSLINLE